MKVNEYFDGNVTSIGFENAEGRATVGVMNAGEYEFGTSENERVRVVSGSMEVKLPGGDDYLPFNVDDEFRVAANEKFQLKIPESAAYICFYGEPL